jgi:FkbM family methyltransferase
MAIRSAAVIIRRLTPVRIRDVIFRTGLFFGEMLFPDLRNSLRVLRKRGFQPTFVIDVGAYHGRWTRDFLQIFPNARVLMVEAQPAKEPNLRQQVDASDGRVQLEMALLGPNDHSTVTFFEMETGSSVFEENSDFTRQRVSRETVRLDTLLTRIGLSEPVSLLKLDVQGFELEVLRGALETLGRCELVLLEASLIQINRNCPLIVDVMMFMQEHGFHLYDICSQVRRPDSVLWQLDLLFVSAKSSMRPEPRFWLD